jgi:restriction system protein
MPVPTFDQFIEPILRYLATKPEGAPAREVHDAAASVLCLSDSDHAELLPSSALKQKTGQVGRTTDRNARVFRRTSDEVSGS